MREDALARLAVIRAAAAQVAADRHADDDRRAPVVARAVAHHRQLVADLHHRRPDIVEELDLDHRLELAHGHADRAADDARLGQRRVEDPIVAEHPLQSVRQLEHAALARHQRQRLLPAGVGHVLAEHDDVRIARHFVLQGAVDGRHHGVGLAFGPRRGVEGRRGRVDIGRVDPELGALLFRPRRGERLHRGLVDFLIDLAGDGFERLRLRQVVLGQELLEPGNGIALRLRLALRRRFVQLLVV